MSKSPDIGAFVVSAFQVASERQRTIYEAWINASVRIGGVLPASMLSNSVQRDGEIDLVLRCMEDEFVAMRMSERPEAGMFHLRYQKIFSEVWIGSVYENFRIIKEIQNPPAESELAALAHDLRLLRIPLEKHQIAGDDKITEPLQMMRHPPVGNETDFVEYATGNKRRPEYDPMRSHIMPGGISSRGSCMWHVIDIVAGTSFWIERRELSDRILNLYAPRTPQG